MNMLNAHFLFASSVVGSYAKGAFRAALIGIAASFVAFGPVSAKVVEMDSFKDWSVFRDDSGQERVCYMSSVPKKLRGNYDRNNRGETRVFVTHFGKSDRNVVSVLAGYKYKKQSDVTFNIDGKEIVLFTQDNRGYSFNEADDSTLVTRMKRGSKLVVTGISSRGNETIDEYSLSGFTKAKALLDKLCK
ncbi:MAG: invasion associated locus B family protein [Candidatus Puniceispirillaceae bacterium]